MTKQPRSVRGLRASRDRRGGYGRLAMTLLLVALAFPAHAVAAAAAAESFFSLNTGDLRAEAADARTDGKKAVLLVFEQEGCPYCRVMRERILSRKDVQDFYRANFVNLPVDIWSAVPIRDFAGREHTEKDFARAAKVTATPTFVFYDVGGNEVVRFAGTTNTAEEFLLLGQFVASGAYKTRSFAQYKATKPARKGG